MVEVVMLEVLICLCFAGAGWFVGGPFGSFAGLVLGAMVAKGAR